MKSYDLKTTEGGSVPARLTAHDAPGKRKRGGRQGLRRGIVALALPLAVTMAVAMAAAAQTRVDLRTQSKNVDFSAASSTKPSRTGTTLPNLCSVGETFLKTDAPAGKNLYVCTAANTWTVQG